MLGPSAARSVLERLADVAAARSLSTPPPSVAQLSGLDAWLVRHDLAPLARTAFLAWDAELAARLTPAAFGAAAANLAHFETLAALERRFEKARVGMVLLKGASAATTWYADPSFRPMTDLDLWVPEAEMARAVGLLAEAGFRQDPGLAHRPEALQRLSGGELVFRPDGGRHGLVELHFSPFPGWWIRRTADPDLAALWARSEAMGRDRHARRLAAEDALLQTSFHVVVNQFGQAPLRGLMDLAVIARARALDWDAVADRARRWRLAHATWLALDTANRLIGLPGVEPALARLRPSRGRLRILRSLLTPGSLLAGRDLTRPARRHPFMLALVDRPRDAGRLIGRAVWPERWWVAARHGRSAGRLAHVRHLLRRGEV